MPLRVIVPAGEVIETRNHRLARLQPLFAASATGEGKAVFDCLNDGAHRFALAVVDCDFELIDESAEQAHVFWCGKRKS
jgi:hypothetical protein